MTPTEPQIAPPEQEAREARLDELRERAAREAARAVGPVERAPGYYGQPVVKPPVWTWEIPVYFMVGGLAGGAAMMALPAAIAGARSLALWALWTATAGGAAGAALLIADLGRPARFFNMLRVLKWQSPMSVGAWTLAAFSAVVGATALLLQLAPLDGFDVAGVLVVAGAGLAGILGAVLATYTGVLIGATAIPVWARHHRLLPVHFGVAGLGSAAAAFELVGFAPAPLIAIGYGVGIAETVILLWVELSRRGAADEALHQGFPGSLMQTAGILAGPIVLLARLADLHLVAAACFLAGALISRFAWVRAGRRSARDSAAALA